MDTATMVAALQEIGRLFREQKRVPLEVFHAWCENLYTAPIDLAPLRRQSSGEPEILLVYRKDEYYDGYHIPGATMIPGSNPEKTIETLIERELGPAALVEVLGFIDIYLTPKGTGDGQNVRGHEIKLLYAAQVNGSVREGEWFTFNNLPPNVIPEHRPLLSEISNWCEMNLPQ